MDKEKKKYLVQKGLLTGIIFAVLWSLMMASLKPGSFIEFRATDWKRFLQMLIIAVPVFLTAGFLQAFFNYKKYKK